VNREPGTNRLEAFSDGVFAIAITLLILEVKVPDGAGSLAHRLGRAWPSYASFLISFGVIGTMWLNHDRMFQLIHRSDHGVVLANLFLLLVISAIPFPTKVVGDELNRGTFADQRTATILYGLTFVGASIAFPLLWHAACRGGGRLLAPDLPDRERLIHTRRNLLGFPHLRLGHRGRAVEPGCQPCHVRGADDRLPHAERPARPVAGAGRDG